MDYQSTPTNSFGSVFRQEIKCGKSNCHCLKGKKHRAYYHYYYERDNSGNLILKKMYVQKNELKRLRERLCYWNNKRKFHNIFIKKGYFQEEFYYLLYYANEQELFNQPLSQWYKRLHILLKKANMNFPEISETEFNIPYELKPFTLSNIPNFDILLKPITKETIVERKRKLKEYGKMLS